jgi:hypothetical protein
MGTHTFTPKSIGDPVSLFDPNDTFVRVSTVEGSGNGYYVVDGMYFTSGAGNGRGSLEASKREIKIAVTHWRRSRPSQVCAGPT